MRWTLFPFRDLLDKRLPLRNFLDDLRTVLLVRGFDCVGTSLGMISFTSGSSAILIRISDNLRMIGSGVFDGAMMRSTYPQQNWGGLSHAQWEDQASRGCV